MVYFAFYTFRLKFETVFLVFKCLRGLAPVYLVDYCKPCGCADLRSVVDVFTVGVFFTSGHYYRGRFLPFVDIFSVAFFSYLLNTM